MILGLETIRKIGDQMFFKYYIIHFKTQLYVFL